MGIKISLRYNAKYSEIFTFFQQDDENKLTTCVSVVLSQLIGTTEQGDSSLRGWGK